MLEDGGMMLLGSVRAVDCAVVTVRFLALNSLSSAGRGKLLMQSRLR